MIRLRALHRISTQVEKMRVRQALVCCIATTTSSMLQVQGFAAPGMHRSLGLTIAPRSVANLGQQSRMAHTKTTRYMSNDDEDTDGNSNFQTGTAIQIEVMSFGPLGASVEVVGEGHNPDNLISETAPALGRGLILQKEIHYFRQARDYVDVVQGEVLPAFVEKVRDDGLLDICLRKPGGKAKAEEVSVLIMERLKQSADGTLSVGDKSSPDAIGDEFPGVSKGAFKKAVSALYKLGKVKPGPDSVSLVK
mmetsp:Transcript_496/g.818  ORF Transcript_496/g.818 Transcript_496/m.818 type:complete len:250 (+) Transcript_496:96-845(+)